MSNFKESNLLLVPSADFTNEPIIENKIYEIRGKQVMLDSDVAFYFQIETKRLNQQMQRNKTRFPEEFCFKLNSDEFKSLRLQNVTSNDEQLEHRNSTSKILFQKNINKRKIPCKNVTYEKYAKS